MGTSGYKYGSVNTDEESGDTSGNNKSFDESELYYMKDGDLSKKEKTVKAIKLAVPIVIAIMLIGGLAFLLFHNFAYFYPGRGGNEVPSKHSISSGVSTTKTTQKYYHDDDTSVAPMPAPSSVGSSCAANQKCADLGLVGECCPSESGTNLSCCS